VLGPADAQRWRATVSRTFECVRDSPREARHFVLRLLRQWHLDGGHGAAGPAGAAARSRLVTDAALVVTELATNAVLHGRSAFTVSAALSEGPSISAWPTRGRCLTARPACQSSPATAWA